MVNSIADDRIAQFFSLFFLSSVRFGRLLGFFHFELAEIEISYFALCVDTLMETKLFTIEIQFNC